MLHPNTHAGQKGKKPLNMFRQYTLCPSKLKQVLSILKRFFFVYTYLFVQLLCLKQIEQLTARYF